MKKIQLFFTVMVIFFCVQKISNAQTDQTFDFETLSLPDTGFWNGADKSNYNSSFGDNYLVFNNYYADYGSYDYWDGFAFSNWIDTNVNGFNNQWSVYAGRAYSGSVFGLCYVPTDWNDYSTVAINIDFTHKIFPKSFYIANSTYTALSIKYGSFYNQAFSTLNKDYYKILITAYENENVVGDTEIYLADYRTLDSMLVKDWQKVDLSSFPKANRISLKAITSDTSEYGPNTPLYFCIDNFEYTIPETSISETNQNLLTVYPNPTANRLQINSFVEKLQIFDLTGRIVKEMSLNTENPIISVADLQANTYFIKVKTNNEIRNGKFVKL